MIYIPEWLPGFLRGISIWVPVVVMLVATGISVYTDIKWRKILNKVTFTTFLVGVAWNIGWILFYSLYIRDYTIGNVISIFIELAIMFGIMFGIFYIMYMMGGMGAGDVKLMGALSMWLFPWGQAPFTGFIVNLKDFWLPWQTAAWITALIAVAGGIFALYYVRKAKLGKQAIQYMKMGGQVKMDLVDQQKTYIPYGVPIAFGTLAFILFIWL